MPKAYPYGEKVFKHLIWICHGHRIKYESFNSLNQSVVAWFSHLHQVGFQPTLTNLGKRLWWYWCECEAICPSTTCEGAHTPHIGMTWRWNAVWKVLQSCSGRVCTVAEGRISANSHKSGEVSVEVMVWMWSHMPTHNLRRWSNLSYMYDMDMGCSLKGSTASTKV